jgi:hypothetical protein
MEFLVYIIAILSDTDFIVFWALHYLWWARCLCWDGATYCISKNEYMRPKCLVHQKLRMLKTFTTALDALSDDAVS